jgi:protoporphyrinogen oxidase/predicted dehydrogenase
MPEISEIRGSGRVRVGVVGLGYWGPNLVRNLAELQQVEVAVFCDVRTEALEAISRRYEGVTCTTSFDELLADQSLDALLIATPVSTHYALAKSALAAGKHVFVEKPLATSAEEVRELTASAFERGLVLMPGHTFLYSPPVTAIKELIDVGELGEIYFVSTSRVNLGLHQPDASVVWDLGPHDFSILRYWLDEVPLRVSAVSRSCIFPGTPDVAFVDLEYASGTIAHVELSWLSPSKLRRTAIVGSKKMVVYDDTSTEPVRIFDSGATLRDPETFGEYNLTYRTGEIVSPRIDATEPLSLELLDFCNAILEGTAVVSSLDVGLDVIRTIEAVDRSLAAGGAPVSFDEEAPAASLDVALRTRVEEVAKPPGLESALGSSAPSREGSDGGESIGTAILGAGPAGLSAAYLHARRGRPAAVFEADGTVGGISKTVEFNGYRFDLGGHRFFTKLAPVKRLWEEMLGAEFLTRPRLSRIYYNGKFFSYPIAAKDVVARLGIFESTRCAASYLWASRRRGGEADTFEEWVTDRFGRRLYDAFFRSYTEKVWGIPGSEIRSLWAAQRIKDFSLGRAILSILGLNRRRVTTLIEEFHYPRLGPGQMWEAFAADVAKRGVPVNLKQRCVALKHSEGRIESIALQSNGFFYEHNVDAVLSSIPLSELVLRLDPPAPPDVQDAARRLRYRDLILVALMTTEEEPFPDNWIYLHDPETRAGRVQNYGAWSSAMVRPGTTCLGVEYFCFEGDELWEMREEDIIELATQELARIGLIDPTKVVDGVKVLVPKAYPMYDAGYEEALQTIRPYLARFENLETCGRNGLHRYNNQDHSMWTAILAAQNLIDGTSHDVWSVNTEADYLEEGDLVKAVLDISAADAEPAVAVDTVS